MRTGLRAVAPRVHRCTCRGEQVAPQSARNAMLTDEEDPLMTDTNDSLTDAEDFDRFASKIIGLMIEKNVATFGDLIEALRREHEEGK